LTAAAQTPAPRAFLGVGVQVVAGRILGFQGGRLATAWLQFLVSDCSSFVKFGIWNVIWDIVVEVFSVVLGIGAVLGSFDVIEAVLLVANEPHDESFEDFKIDFFILQLRQLVFRQVLHLA